jgi:hypothetical protein
VLPNDSRQAGVTDLIDNILLHINIKTISGRVEKNRQLPLIDDTLLK